MSTIFGLTAQIDLGNALVGLGAMGVGYLSFVLARRAAEANSLEKLSEFKKSKLENLRLNIAEFHAIQCQLGVLAYNTRKKEYRNEAEFSRLNERSQTLRSNIRLLIDHKNPLHLGLEEAVDMMHRATLDKFKGEFRGKFIDEEGLQPLIDQARSVLIAEENTLYRS